jgi:uncharacterized protein (TIGR00730 family)
MTRPDLGTPAFSLCVYCGSRLGTDPAYAEAARAVGGWIGRYRGQLVYGGGKSGLMGIVADAALAAGARVVGVIPQALVEREHAHHGCTELIVVPNMHERKRVMAERSHAFVALAGGIGTFEEMFEIWSWRLLGYHDKPLGLLNTGGYYDGLIAFVQHCVRAGLMDDTQMALLRVARDWQTLLPNLIEAAGFPAPARIEAI